MVNARIVLLWALVAIVLSGCTPDAERRPAEHSVGAMQAGQQSTVVDATTPAITLSDKTLIDNGSSTPPADAAAIELRSAPNWQLLTHQGTMYGSQNLQGRPYVLVLYLGRACLHCFEQLQQLAAVSERFKQGGIEIIAVSTDDDVTLQRSLDEYGSSVPFVMLADEDLRIFKAFDVVDKGSGQPLHGIFVIDARHEIRWHDIGSEPYMDIEFVLTEASKLAHDHDSKQGGEIVD
ncbi:MAG TPA: peroxiredoxin family protein [Pirellulaceae bacterium]|nr:peroxiredoxin family protein [Pirellulaceae bacterium]HMO91060.1 peroxiredoxin family protein [Pirellulaceae bacterium]HMP68175.1 peroxiredoxin family protein [Pirellulaceae bacterium]